MYFSSPQCKEVLALLELGLEWDDGDPGTYATPEACNDAETRPLFFSQAFCEWEYSDTQLNIGRHYLPTNIHLVS